MLSPAINKKKTIAHSKAVLKSYQSLCRIANAPITQRLTATYTFEPRSFTGTTSNTIEKQMMRKLSAEQLLTEIEQAINKIIDPTKRIILIEKYCQTDVKDVSIMHKIKLYDSEFYRQLDDALLWFAEFYKNGQIQIYNKNSLSYELIFKDLGVNCDFFESKM